MQLSNLKPTEKRHVYDLLQDAGMDVNDWSNYKLSHVPAANPKYCYNWAFEEDNLVVLCLWLEDMKEDKHGIYQQLNYREINASAFESSVRKRRAGEMDDAFQAAKNKNLRVRVIVVDGPVRAEREEGASPVERRGLDSEPWHIEAYGDDGDCQIRRGPKNKVVDADGNHKLARIAYNSNGWRSPSGDAGSQEASTSHNSQNNFGYEEWLFRDEWSIDGWRYAFIEGFNTKSQAYAGKSLDVSLYTIELNKRCRLVGTINEVEGLTESQAEAAVEAFKAKEWFATIKAEIEAIGGNSDALDNTDWAPHILNVRFRSENVDLYPTDTYLDNNKWLKDRHRYILYNFDKTTQDAIERGAAKQKGSHDAPKSKRLFRKGTKPLEYTPEHQIIQSKLVEELRNDYAKESITCEQDFVDIRVETDSEVIYFEIKTDLNTRSVIRQALGQLLEYAYHPARDGRQPDQLVIVGRSALTGTDAEYLRYLSNELKLPLSYRQVEI